MTSHRSSFRVAGIAFSLLCLLLLAGLAHRLGGGRWEHRLTPGVGGATLALSADGTDLVLSEDGGQTWRRPLGEIRELEIFGNSLDNLLTVDFTNGDPVPAGGLLYHGLDEETPEGDAIVLVGQPAASTSYQPTAEKDGTLRIGGAGDPGRPSAIIAFTGLEPVIDEIVTANLIVNGTGASNSITVAEAGDTTRTRVTIDAFEYIDFKNKTTLMVNAMGGNDTITVEEPTGATSLSGIQVDGGADDDTVNLVSVPVDLSTTDVEELQVDGTGPGVATAQSLDVQGLIMNFDIAGTTPGTEHDQISATSVDLTDSILQINPLFVPDPGMSFVIINVSGGVVGNFINLGEGDLIPGGINGVPTSITYNGGDGDDVVLVTFNHRADIRAGKKPNPDSHGGNDEYGTAVPAQNVNLKLKSNATKARFFFSAQNDSGTDGDIQLYASFPSRRLKVQYLQISPVAENVTADILRALLFADVQNPDDTFSFRAILRPRRKNIRETIFVRAQPVDDIRQIDRSAIRVRRK